MVKKIKTENSFSIPELPELPRLPNFLNAREAKSFPEHAKIPDSTQELFDFPVTFNREKELNNFLPTFPDSDLGNQITQEAIKNSVSSDLGYPKQYDNNQEEIGYPQEEIQQEKPQEIKKPIIQRQVGNKPVFVKIDNFKQSLELFNDINRKIQEIQGLMSEIKQTKEREETSLESWNLEIQSLKENLEEINQKLFSKIE